MSPLDDPGLARLVTGLLVPGLVGNEEPEWLPSALDAGLAGVCWFGGDSLATTRAAHPGLLVMADEEGGNVTRLEAARGSSFPGNAALGALDDTVTTKAVGAAIGSMSAMAGIDIVLAPVVDVNAEPENPVIGVRSFGADPALVARHGAAFARGVQSRGVAACAKHFPGHGATRTDSHTGLPVVGADRETFLARDVAPFAAVVDADVRCVMTAHVVVPAFDDAPATLSSLWLDHLRSELGFGGAILSDALDMHAISRGIGRGPGAVATLRAGVDLVCIGNPHYPEWYDAAAVLDEIRTSVLAAIDDGELRVERLEAASSRVGALRDWLAAQRTARAETFDPSAAVRLGRSVAVRTIQAFGPVELAAAPHVVVEDRTEVAAGRVASPLLAALARRAPATTSEIVRTAAELTPLPAERPVVLVTDGIAGDAVMRAVRGGRADCTVVHTGPADHFPIAPPAVFALGSASANAEAVVDLLLGDADRQG